MKSFALSLLCFLILAACNNNEAVEQAEKKQDSIEQKELDEVDDMLIQSDSLMKAKEKELLEQYSH